MIGENEEKSDENITDSEEEKKEIIKGDIYYDLLSL
jgi:hypothetical protein